MTWVANRHGLQVNPTFKHFLPALAEKERDGLDREIVEAGGPSDPIIFWKKTQEIVDGYNRYEICECRELPYPVHGIDFADEAAVCSWIVRRQMGRRNLSLIDREKLARKLSELLGGVRLGSPKKNGAPPILDQISEITGENKALVRERVRRSRLTDKLAEPLRQAYESGQARLITGELAALGNISKAEQVSIYEAWQDGTHKSLGESLEHHLGIQRRAPRKPAEEPAEYEGPDDDADADDEEMSEAIEQSRSPLDVTGDFQRAMQLAGQLVRQIDALGKNFLANRGDYYEKSRRNCDVLVEMLTQWQESENGSLVGGDDW